MAEEYKQTFLEEKNEYPTLDEVRALISSSMTRVTSPMTVASSYMQSEDFATGSKGWQIKANGDVEFNNGNFRGDITGATGTFSGSLTGGSLNIPNTTTANSFHTDATGNSWWGCNVADFGSDNDNAKAYILNTGAAKFQDIDIVGTVSGRSTATLAAAIDESGHFADAAINTATGNILGEFTFGTSGAIQIGSYVNGASGDVRISPTGILGRDSSGSTTFSIDATTGVATISGLVVGTNVGIGTAQDSAGVTTIIGNTVTASFVNALSITAGSVSASGITSGTLSSKTITLGITAGTGDSYIGSGKTDFTNAQAGFILGVDDSDSDTAKFFIGNDTSYLNWTGDNLDITSSRQLEVFTAGESITAGQSLCLGRGVAASSTEGQIISFRSAGVDSLNPDTNYHGATSYRVNSQLSAPARQEWVLVDFEFEDFADVFTNCAVWFYTNSGTVNVAGPFTVTIYPITSAWDEETVTYNNLPTLGTALGSFQVENSDGSMYHSVDLTNFMWKIKASVTTAPYGFLLKGSQSNANNGYVNLFLETSANQEPGLRGRRMLYRNKVFKAKSATIEGDSQEYRCFNFIGFAAEAAEAEDSIRVITQGTVSGLSGLIPGEAYYVGEGAGDIDTSFSISSNKPLYKIGRAITDTKLLIEKGEITYDYVITSQTANPFYLPTYFRPIEIEAWSGGSSGFEHALLGRYISKNQYHVAAGYHVLTTGSMGFATLSYTLQGGVVFNSFPADTIALLKMKG